MTGDEEIQILERHVAQLGEHFQSVRIITTRHQDGQTFTVTSGAGNFHAQVGSVREWMMRQDERVLENERKLGREDDDG